MELKLQNGDYLPDGAGGLQRAVGREAAIQRALFRLSVRRESFPFFPELGSRLYLLPQEALSGRKAAAQAYVAEALAPEQDLSILELSLSDGAEGTLLVTVHLLWGGESLQLTAMVR